MYIFYIITFLPLTNSTVLLDVAYLFIYIKQKIELLFS